MEDARNSGMDARSLANLRESIAGSSQPISTDLVEIHGRFSIRVGYDGIWPSNVPIMDAFLAVSLQWRVVSRGGGGAASAFGGSFAPVVPMFIGLDYTAVRAGLDAEGIAVTPELWRGLRAMESEAVSVLNEVSR